MPEIIYLIGPAGCGKSTYLENKINESYVNISSDKIIENFMETHNLSYNQSIMSMKQDDTYRQLVNDMINAVNKKKNIIVDRTNILLQERYFTMRYVTDDYTRIGVIFNVYKDKLLFRIKRREILTGKYIDIEVVKKMINNFEKFIFPHGREFNKIEMIYN